MQINLDDIKDILIASEKPARYIGGEYGATKLKWTSFNFCMCFPDVYEVAISNLGIKIVAESFNKAGLTADRCYCPWRDFGDKLKQKGVPLYSLDLKRELKDFDMLGFSLQYELSYTNILYMLDLAKIPLLKKDRGDDYPIIACGGPCAVNPEPLVDFVDIFFIGDGEEVDVEVAKLYLTCKNREEFYQKASCIRGVYVPSLMDIEYENGKIRSFKNKVTNQDFTVKKALISNLDVAIFPEQIPVPNIEAVHDRAVIEIMRGCYRGCRFCQAGFIYRPVRPKNVNTLTKQACSLIKQTGYSEVSMNSLSTGDYPYLRELIKDLKQNLPSDVTLALPSLRVDSFDNEFAQDSRKTSLTFAPEAGTQRLRDVINKDVSDEEIMRAVKGSFDLGYFKVKLYFMLGLPTETDEDLEGIKKIVQNICEEYYKEKRSKKLTISVSVSTFIPKPFTPFQWERQASLKEVEEKQNYLRKLLNIKGVKFAWNDYFTSSLEAVLARGDRKLGQVLLNAYKNGCVFDGWNDQLNKQAWRDAFETSNVKIEDYTREYDENELLPWDFIDILVDKKFLLKEKVLAYSGKVTGSCKNGCKACGIQKEFRCNV